MDGRDLSPTTHTARSTSLKSPLTSPSDLHSAGRPPSCGCRFRGTFNATSSSGPSRSVQGDATGIFSRATSWLPTGSNGKSRDVNGLAGNFLRVIKQRDQLQGALDESRRVCKEQSELISTLKSVTELAPPLHKSPMRSDFALVANWNASDAKYCSKMPYQFVVDSQGNWVGRPRVSYAIQVGKAILQELNELGMLSSSWRRCSIRPINLFINTLEQDFVEFTYCSNHWKADHFARLIFPEWKRAYGRTPKSVNDGKRKRGGNESNDVEDDQEDKDDLDDQDFAALSDNHTPQPTNADGRPAKKKQRRTDPGWATSGGLPNAHRADATPPRSPGPTIPPASGPPRAMISPQERPERVPESVPEAASRPDAGARTTPSLVPTNVGAAAQQHNNAQPALQPAVRSAVDASGHAGQLDGEDQQTAGSARQDRVLSDLQAQTEGPDFEPEAPVAGNVPVGPVAHPKGTKELPLRKKSASPEMHVRVAWARRTPRERFSRPEFEAYLQTAAGKAEREVMENRVKTCQDTGLDA